jgi:hypothetical protein
VTSFQDSASSPTTNCITVYKTPTSDKPPDLKYNRKSLGFTCANLQTTENLTFHSLVTLLHHLVCDWIAVRILGDAIRKNVVESHTSKL